MDKLFSNFDKKILNLILTIEKISLIVSFLGILGLYIFLKYYIDIKLYYISLTAFQSGLTAGVCAICFGIFFNKIKNEDILKK